MPSVTFEVVRSDDLVALEIEAINLRLDKSQLEAPLLVRTGDPGDALLVVRLPPQTIAELVQLEGELGRAAGDSPARISGGSRLVFRLPAGVDSIPYTIRGVLDWSRLEPVLSPVARVARGESPAVPPAIAEPGPAETAIEQPYRLVLSAQPGFTWTSETAPVVHGSRTELWHARLAHAAAGGAMQDVSLRAPATARAIWSPDYAGPGVIPNSVGGEPGFPTAMNQSDRHQLVALTSDFQNLETPIDLGFDPFPLRPIRAFADRYVPDPADIDLWMLSALGGWLRAHGRWGGFELFERPRYIAGGKTIDVSSWRHIAAEGRDHFVEIVYEGSLFPLGHPAARIKVSERRFETDGPGTPPVARLRQYEYIIVRRPFRAYEPSGYQGRGREMPLNAGVRLLTLVTPHILGAHQAPAGGGETPGIPGTEARWVRTHDGSDFTFAAVGSDADGGTVPFTAALIWVPDSDTTGADAETKLKRIKAAYNKAPPSEVPGDSMAFAPGTTPGARDAALPTFAIYFDAQVVGGTYLPTLRQADVRLKPVEAMVGPGATVAVKPYQGYVDGGFDAHAEVFARLLTGTAVKVSADKAGGIATPNVTLTGVGRAVGVLAGDLEHAAQGVFDPTQVFAAADAQLFGSVPLSALLPINGSGLSAAANAPRLHSYQEVGPAGPQSVTALEWVPAIAQPPAGIVKVNVGTTLAIHGRIVQPLSPPGEAPSAPSFSFDGTLSNFRFEILDVVSIGFKSFAFSAGSGRKLDVSVEMGGDPAVQFLGPLEFVSELARKIPAGIFGPNGPSIDLAPDHVTVGATVALPSLPLGVFSLQHLSIDAGVKLPFIDGKPLIDIFFAKRDKPFLLTVALFGGGGFVHVQLDSGGVLMVEGALEFGGAFSLDIGVASGGVQVMAGIYFKLSGPKSDLAGFVDMCGEVSVLGIISVSVEFNLTLSYESPGKARGRATLIVAVHIAFVSKSVELSVERSFGSGNGDPTLSDVMSPAQWATYARAFA